MFEQLLTVKCDWCRSRLDVSTSGYNYAELNLKLVSLGFIVGRSEFKEDNKHYCNTTCEKAHIKESQDGKEEG